MTLARLNMRAFLLCLQGFCLCTGLGIAKDKPEDQARPILKLAEGRALFLPNANSPFKLSLKFRVHGGSGSPELSGTYNWLVTPTGNSRKETSMSDYHDLQVLKSSRLWAKHNLDFVPLQATWAEYALTNFRLISSGFPVERYYKDSDHHVELRCMELRPGKDVFELCIDGDGNLRKVELKQLKITYEYSEYRPVGSKYAPYKITAKRAGGTVLDAEVLALAPASENDESLIEVPAGAKERSGCLNPTLPYVEEAVTPQYPQNARQRRDQGEVIVHVLVAADGSVTQKSVVQTAGQWLDAAGLTAAGQRKYEPAKCQNLPVDSDALIPADFTIEFH